MRSSIYNFIAVIASESTRCSAKLKISESERPGKSKNRKILDRVLENVGRPAQLITAVIYRTSEERVRRFFKAPGTINREH